MMAGAASIHFRVSTTQGLLLVAATQPESAARSAWDEWRAQCKIEAADANCQSLFSLVYANLISRGGGAESNLLNGIYKRTWYANQLALSQMRTLLDLLAGNGIPAVAMNDASLVIGLYRDIGHRTIRCLDVLVHAEHWHRSVDLAAANGWRALRRKPLARSNTLLVIPFSGPVGHTARIWTNLFSAEPQSDTEARIWDAAQECEFMGQPVSTLGPVEQLLCLSADTCREREVPLIRFADARLTVESLRSDFDWTRLVWQAQRYEHILPLRNMLAFLASTLSVPLPPWVLPALNKMAISHGELLQYPRACESLPLRAKSTCLRWFRHFRSGTEAEG